MPLAASNLYTLDVHSPKTKAVITNGVLTAPPAKSVSIHIGSGVDVALRQNLIGTAHQCHRLAQSELRNLAVKVHCTVGGTPVLDGTPGAGDITLSVGADVVGSQQSHFIDRTFKRLIEVILEDAK